MIVGQVLLIERYGSIRSIIIAVRVLAAISLFITNGGANIDRECLVLLREFVLKKNVAGYLIA